ncbi:hypothetical protein GGX14DRAFT_576335 [Mycena pura]|uniref:Uncharacterized protein n=1 Tax=Mycena pura TaxID=153505 RepID=A0AAD6V0P1_9AGAR|nr:hypothetical protein GGX14DRAFT_576335 [Mycena pura]
MDNTQALVINQYVNPLGFQHLNPNQWKLYTIYTCWIAFELVIFDGDEAEVAQVDIAEKVTRDDSMEKVGVPDESPSV